MSEHVYDLLMHKYGLKNVAEKKFMQFINSLLKFKKESTRISIFWSFITEDYSVEDLKMYKKIDDYLKELNVGII